MWRSWSWPKSTKRSVIERYIQCFLLWIKSLLLLQNHIGNTNYRTIILNGTCGSHKISITSSRPGNVRISIGSYFMVNLTRRADFRNEIFRWPVQNSICRGNIENAEHLLTWCDSLNTIWNETVCIIRNYLDSSYVITNEHKIAGYFESNEGTHFINVLLTITRWAIWKRRNSIKYDAMNTSVVIRTIFTQGGTQNSHGKLKQKWLTEKNTRDIISSLIKYGHVRF